ncbi:MAG: hypothetical protein HW402_1542 [Dehalococcoidales bacterium]|nr:hypothetical protein [Dehalococcoidales bacterium]
MAMIVPTANRLPVAAWSALLRLLFRDFNRDCFPASIATTGRAGMVGELGTLALGAECQRRWGNTEMTSSFPLACLSVFSLW